MNQEYLWDKTGERDPEIELLEEILAPLRYQSKPFEIPKDLKLERRRSYFPLLAIAAVIALMLLTTGLWLRLNRQETIEEVKTTPPSVGPALIHSPHEKRDTVISRSAEPRLQRQKPRRNSEAAQKIRAKEREEAEAAKEQIMIALRLASVKMNIARKGAQGTPNIIRNQHKAG